MRKKTKLIVAAGILTMGFLFAPPIKPFRRIAPRTSPYFSRRPINDELGTAAADGDLRKLKQLLNSGVDPNANTSGNEGRSALCLAASNGHLPAVQLLLNRGADVNADDYWGGTPLIGASVNGNVEIVRLLVDHGADLNAEDDGTTALDYASHQLLSPDKQRSNADFSEIIKTLEANGGEVSLLNRPIARLYNLFTLRWLPQ